MRDFLSESPLNTDTPIIRTFWHVPLLSVLTGFHCTTFSWFWARIWVNVEFNHLYLFFFLFSLQLLGIIFHLTHPSTSAWPSLSPTFFPAHRERLTVIEWATNGKPLLILGCSLSVIIQIFLHALLWSQTEIYSFRTSTKAILPRLSVQDNLRTH